MRYSASFLQNSSSTYDLITSSASNNMKPHPYPKTTGLRLNTSTILEPSLSCSFPQFPRFGGSVPFRLLLVLIRYITNISNYKNQRASSRDTTEPYLKRKQQKQYATLCIVFSIFTFSSLYLCFFSNT